MEVIDLAVRRFGLIPITHCVSNGGANGRIV
jgi:hypothetical protein